MEWENQPFGFVAAIVAAAIAGACASGLKEVNGERFRWRRFFCRSFYRSVLASAGGLIISTLSSDLRILLASTILLALSAIGEKQIIQWLPFTLDVSHEQKTKGDRVPD